MKTSKLVYFGGIFGGLFLLTCIVAVHQAKAQAFFSMDYSQAAQPLAGWPNTEENGALPPGPEWSRSFVPGAGPLGQNAYELRQISNVNFGSYFGGQYDWGWRGNIEPAQPNQGGKRFYRWRMMFTPNTNFKGVSWDSGEPASTTNKLLIVGQGCEGRRCRFILSYGGSYDTHTISFLRIQLDGGVDLAEAGPFRVGEWLDVQIELDSSTTETTADGGYKLWVNNNNYNAPNASRTGIILHSRNWQYVWFGAFQNLGLQPDGIHTWRNTDFQAAYDFNPAWHGGVSSTPTLTAPFSPSNLSATINSSSQVTLNWNDNSANETGFRIEKKIGAGGIFTEIATVGANNNSYQNIGLNPNTVYYYRIRSYNAAGNSTYSNETSATTTAEPAPLPPTAPANLSATAATSSQINLSWTDNTSNETGFRIERKTGSAGLYSEIATVGGNVSSYQNTGLSTGTAYYYRIRAYNDVGASGYSNEAYAATPASPDITRPSISITSPASGSAVSGTVSISATALDNIAVAGVQFNLDGISIGPEDTTSPYTISWNSLSSANGNHTISATARDFAGNTAFSSIAVSVSNSGSAEIFFEEGWESGTKNTFNSQYYGSTAGSSQFAVQTNQTATGAYAITHYYPQNGEGHFATQHFGDSIAGPVWPNGRGNSYQDLKVEYKIYYSPGFNFSAGSNKQIIFGTQDDRRHEEVCCNPWAAHYVTIYAGSNGAFQAEANNKQAASGQWVGLTPNMNGYNLSNPYYIKPGQWYSVEVRHKLNDAGQDNGIFEMRINGQLIAYYPNIRYRVQLSGTLGSNFAYGTNFVMLSNYLNSTSPQAQNVYYDDFRLSSSGITAGPIVPVPILPLTAPANLSATAATSSQINLSWTDNTSNETGFRIERKTGSAGLYSEIATVGGNVSSYQNTGLSTGTAYYYRIRAYNDVGASGYSNEAYAATPASPVRPPIGNLDEITPDGMIRGWSFSQDKPASSANVELYLGGMKGQGGVLLTSLSANTPRPDVNTAYQVTGGHGFEYSIPVSYRDSVKRSVYAYGVDSSISNLSTLLQGSPKTFSLSPSAPPTPPRPVLTISNVTYTIKKGSVLTGWNTNLPATSQVEYGTSLSYGSQTRQSNLLTTAHSQPLTNLAPGTYYFRVKSKDASLAEAVSEPNKFVIKGRPSKVSDLQATDGSVVLTWTNPQAEYRGISITRSSLGFQSEFNKALEIGTTLDSYFKDRNVMPKSTYYYSIFVYDDQENYSEPAQIKFTTTAITEEPQAPKPLDYPSGTLYKKPGNPTVLIKEGNVGRPITGFEIYQNNFKNRKVVTLPAGVEIPESPDPLKLKSGTLAKIKNNPTVYLIIGNSKRSFRSREEFLEQGYKFSQIRTLEDGETLNSYQTVASEFVRPTGTVFKYQSSPSVYFLNSNRMKREFSSLKMLELWSASPSLIVTVPDVEVYPDGAPVTLPPGILVKGSSPSIYLTADEGKLKVFGSEAAILRLGFKLQDIITVSDSDLSLHSVIDVIK